MNNSNDCANCAYFLDEPSDDYKKYREGFCLLSVNVRDRTIERHLSYDFPCRFFKFELDKWRAENES